MPRVSPIKPKPIKLDTVTARAVRGPHRDGSGRWYWRADNYIGEGKRETVWTGWATREESRQEVSRLAAQDVREAAQADREARTGSIQTVTDLLELYLGAEAGRVDAWRQEERRGEEAVAKGAATVVLHSRDALAPASYENKLLAGRHIAGDALGRIRLDRLQSDDLRDYVTWDYSGGGLQQPPPLLPNASCIGPIRTADVEGGVILFSATSASVVVQPTSRPDIKGGVVRARPVSGCG